MRFLGIVLFSSLLLITVSACSQNEEPVPSSEEVAPQNQPSQGDSGENSASFELSILAENLNEPWEIAKADDTIYVSERTGSIVSVIDNNQIRKPVELTKDLSSQPEAGLLGIAFPDNFSSTETAFAYYSYKENNTYYQRVVTLEASKEYWEEKAVLLDEIPGGQFHQGGRIEIGPDNKLYITTGDATSPEKAQDPDSLAGKILRMNLDGSVPDDNPYRDSYVYSYGHRNPQGLAWDSEQQLYATEHGSNALDEVNRIMKGGNYGWPVIRGDETHEGMISPVTHSGDMTWAPSGMTYFEGFFYFASLSGEALHRFNPAQETQQRIISNAGRIRDAFSTENGIYYLTNNTDGRGNPDNNDDKLLFLPQGHDSLN